MPSIFVSFRKVDNRWIRDRVYRELAEAFGANEIFKSGESIPAGGDFGVILRRQAAECKVMLVLIGTAWSEARDAAGGRLLDRHDDWVRTEIATALSAGNRVIPVLLGDTAVLPAPVALPDDIAALAHLQFLRVPETHLTDGLQRLVTAMSGLLPELGTPRTPATGLADSAVPPPVWSAVTQNTSGGNAVSVQGGAKNARIAAGDIRETKVDSGGFFATVVAFLASKVGLAAAAVIVTVAGIAAAAGSGSHSGTDGSPALNNADSKPGSGANVVTAKQFTKLQKHANDVVDVSFSADGNTIASSGEDQVTMLSSSTDQNKQSAPSSILSAFSPDTPLIAVLNQNDLAIDLYGSGNLGTSSGSIALPTGAAGFTDFVIAKGADGDELAASTVTADRTSGTVSLWSVGDDGTSSQIATSITSDRPVNSVALSPGGRLVAGVTHTALSGSDGIVKIWNAVTGEQLAAVPDPTARSVTFSPDGRTLAIAGESSVQLWDAEALKVVKTVGFAPIGDLTAGAPPVASPQSIAFSPDGNTLAFVVGTGENGTEGGTDVELWSVSRTIPVAVLHNSLYIYTLAFSPDGRFVATGGGGGMGAPGAFDCSVHLWDVSSYTR